MVLFGQVVAAETAPVVRPPMEVLVFGDSLSAAYNLAPEQGWAHLLDQKLSQEKAPWRVRNASVSGETTAGGLSRLPALLKQFKPDVLVLELGANDGLRGLPLDLAKANLGKMITLAKAQGTRVLLVGMEIPPNYGPEYTGEFRAMYQELAKTHQVDLLPFLLAPIAEDRNNFLDDNLHPTASAQALVMAHVFAHLQPLLK